ncbi:MAG: Crp/Fnr family transcriptional regulator [Pseudomonadota bacterium]
MTTNKTALGSNYLLNLLSDDCRQSFVSNCDLVSLNLGDILGNSGDTISYVYFPVEGIISWEKQVVGSPYLVVALIGNEGMLCISLLLGVDITLCRAVVQKSGFALRIPAASFTHQIAQKPTLDLILKRYAYVSYNQIMQLAACNIFHLLENRLARLLLMFQDRLQSDELHITHGQLAQMLGVRRVGVTKAAGTLQRQNLISYTRGDMIIHDVNGLKAFSCICYQTDISTYENTLQHI